MSLPRELAVIFLSVVSAFFLLRTTFLLIESFLITPASHPLLSVQAHSFGDLPPNDSILFGKVNHPAAKLSIPTLIKTQPFNAWQSVESLIYLQ